MLFMLGLVISQPCAGLELNPASKEVQCGDRIEIVKSITGSEWKEIPLWHGIETTSESNYILFSNLKKQTWTLIQYQNDIACVIGSGSGSFTSFTPV